MRRVEALRYPAFRHPLGLALLATSTVLAIAAVAVPQVFAIPQIAHLSGRAAWLLVVGILAYLATAAVVLRAPIRSHSSDLRAMRRIRWAMAAQLDRLQTGGSSGTGRVLIPIVTEALSDLDEQILPKLNQVVGQHETLRRQLRQYETGVLPSPAPPILERLRASIARKQEVTALCVQQAANAEAVLGLLTQEADEGAIRKDAQLWAQDLRDLHDGLTEAIRSDGHVEPEPVVPPASQVTESRLLGNLTAREVEVLRMIASGLTAKEIKTELYLALPTVQRHIQNIYGKIGAQGRADATRWYIEHFGFPQSSPEAAQATVRIEPRGKRTT